MSPALAAGFFTTEPPRKTYLCVQITVINNLRCADDTTLIVEIEGAEELLDEGERREWKNWLKAQF